jgi:hypothetical protein
MATERRRLLLLVALTAVLATAVYRAWPTTSVPANPASNRQGPRSGAPAPGAQTGASAATDVHLDALDGERPQPGAAGRDLFRFKPKAPPPAPASFSSQPASTGPATMSGPGGTGAGATASVPPITLKFIGVMESPERAQKIAVLTDGRGAPFYGKEGEVVEGRYRILKIGVESIDIAYADGRGRQTIRLTGQ